MELMYIFRIGKWYYERLDCGVSFTTDINEANKFYSVDDLVKFIGNNHLDWVADEIQEKKEAVGEPIILETIVMV